MLIKKILEENYIHVIDDFYNDLGWLDHHLRNGIFHQLDNVNFPGHSSFIPAEFRASIQSRIEVLLGRKFKNLATNGEVRIACREDQPKTYIHVDHSLILLIYLCDPPDETLPEDHGTSFYFHKYLKSYRFVDSSITRRVIQLNTLDRDTNDKDAWEKWLTIPMKKNRAVIYDGNLFHSGPEKAWGKSLQEGRITQHFFLKPFDPLVSDN